MFHLVQPTDEAVNNLSNGASLRRFEPRLIFCSFVRNAFSSSIPSTGCQPPTPTHTPTHHPQQTSDHNEIEVSRAHRRGTYVGSPISTVASAAVAVKLATTGKPALDPVDERRASLPGRSASKLWQRAAQVGGGCVSDASGTVRHLGFNAVAAIRALHGVSVQQLKRRLDECYARREEVSPFACEYEYNCARSPFAPADLGCNDWLSFMTCYPATTSHAARKCWMLDCFRCPPET